MTREKRIGMTLVLAGLLIGIAVIAVIAVRESRSLYYTLVFSDAEGLQPGDRVQMSGVNIGVVKWVQLNAQPSHIHVRVKIDPKYAEMVRLNSTAVIRGVSFPNVSGQRVIEVVNQETTPPAPPLPKDALVQGVNGALDLQVWKVKGKFKGSGDAFSQAIGAMNQTLKGINDSMKDLLASPEMSKTIRDLRDFMRQMQDQGREAVAQLQAQWPKLREDLKPVLQHLQTMGRTYLVEEIQAMMRQIEQTLDQWQHSEKAPAATPTPEKHP